MSASPITKSNHTIAFWPSVCICLCMNRIIADSAHTQTHRHTQDQESCAPLGEETKPSIVARKCTERTLCVTSVTAVWHLIGLQHKAMSFKAECNAFERCIASLHQILQGCYTCQWFTRFVMLTPMQIPTKSFVCVGKSLMRDIQGTKPQKKHWGLITNAILPTISGSSNPFCNVLFIFPLRYLYAISFPSYA